MKIHTGAGQVPAGILWGGDGGKKVPPRMGQGRNRGWGRDNWAGAGIGSLPQTRPIAIPTYRSRLSKICIYRILWSSFVSWKKEKNSVVLPATLKNVFGIVKSKAERIRICIELGANSSGFLRSIYCTYYLLFLLFFVINLETMLFYYINQLLIR